MTHDPRTNVSTLAPEPIALASRTPPDAARRARAIARRVAHAMLGADTEEPADGR